MDARANMLVFEGFEGLTGDLLSGRFWRWMLLVCQLFTHDSHDLKADVPILAVKTKQRANIFSYAPVSAPISGQQMVWRHLQCS